MEIYMKKQERPHYVNNAEFSAAVVEYVKSVNRAKENQEPLPVVTDYIASCFMKIAEGLSHKSNFIRYTYREEMVMDAVENCLKAIENYNIEASTRSGKPNAFAYFTQISWYAFIRRITKEKKQQDIKMKYITQSPISEFVDTETDVYTDGVVRNYLDQLKQRITAVRERDSEVKEYIKKHKVKQKQASKDSDLGDVLG